jgi:hypothetical protein
MQVTFKFSIGQPVVKTGRWPVSGEVMSASIGASGVNSYWISYVDSQGTARELHAYESELIAG